MAQLNAYQKFLAAQAARENKPLNTFVKPVKEEPRVSKTYDAPAKFNFDTREVEPEDTVEDEIEITDDTFEDDPE